MSRSVNIVVAFAALSFFLPLLLWGYYAFMNDPYTDSVFYVCPTSILSMGLDHTSRSTAIVVWFLICLSNACLYAFPPATVIYGIHLGRRLVSGEHKPPSILN